MSTLYLTEIGSVVRRESGRIIVTCKNKVLLDIPFNQVEAVVVFPGIHITTSLIASWLAQGVPVTYLSNRGKYYGRLEPLKNVHVLRHLKQVDCMRDPDFRLIIAKKMLHAKIRNSMTVVRAFARHQGGIRHPEVYDRIRRSLERLQQAPSIERMIGYEGAASKDYLYLISDLTRSEFRFSGRSRNPPKDPFNSMLSFGYTLLLFDLYTLIASNGLHPYFGFLHKPRNGHAALASDLMEEWRPILVDAFVLHLANRNSFRTEDFETDQFGGVYLNWEQSRHFICRYEERVKKTRTSSDGTTKFDYRIQLERQVKMLAKAVDEQNPDFYTPYYLR